MIYLITHGDRFFGPNPGHTAKGFEQIRALKSLLPHQIKVIVIGTGKRFIEIYETIYSSVWNIPVKNSPFCGSVDGLEPNNKVVLIDGTLVDLKNDYIGLSAPCFDAWWFINLFPDHALLCSGSELMIALGLRDINEKGQLYELNPRRKVGWKIS